GRPKKYESSDQKVPSRPLLGGELPELRREQHATGTGSLTPKRRRSQMLFNPKKLSVRSLLVVAALGAAAVAQAENPVQMDIGSFAGFPTNPQTKVLDNIGNVTGS